MRQGDHFAFDLSQLASESKHRTSPSETETMGSSYSSLAHADDNCPVDHKNMSKEELDGMMAQYKRVGHAKFVAAMSGSKDGDAENDTAKADTAHPLTDGGDNKADSCSGAPIHVSEEQNAAGLPSRKKEKQAKDVQKETTAQPTVYDVYGQEIDRANLMPATPNQLPSPGQTQPLSTDRVKSTIPKVGEGDSETWTYPSPQMFYNALRRKGKADGMHETDVDIVVHVHNNMNERTWNEVMEWEKRYHCDECANPKLKRFQGKPHDLSPTARFRMWFRNYPKPFDRHDWILDRCGKAEARYIIDYYYRDGPDPIELHVRPAIDSVSAAFDRLRQRAMVMRDSLLGEAETKSPAEQAAAHNWSEDRIVAGESLEDNEFAFLSNITPESLNEIAEDVQKRCAKVGEAFRQAGDDPAKMEQANISANYCMAQSICKPQAAEFMNALETGGEEAQAYAKMTSCLDRFHIMARRALLEASGIAQSGPEFPAGVTPSVASHATPAPSSSVEDR